MVALVGYCSIAIIFAIIAFKKAKKGKKYTTLLTVGLVLYAMAFFGNLVGNKDTLSMIGYLRFDSGYVPCLQKTESWRIIGQHPCSVHSTPRRSK